MGCEQLPELVVCSNWSEFDKYDEQLYQIFKQDFIDSCPIYKGRRVAIRRNPLINNKEQTFFHLTSKDYKGTQDRCPDPRRCERIKWIRKFIENNFCVESCKECSGVKVWEETYKTNTRIYFLLEEEQYVVIIEKRESYCLLITAYYLDYSHALEKLLKKHNKYKAKSASPT